MSPRREEEAEAEVESGQPGADQANNVEPDGYAIAVDHGFSRGAVVWGGWAVVGPGKPVRGRDRDQGTSPLTKRHGAISPITDQT